MQETNNNDVRGLTRKEYLFIVVFSAMFVFNFFVFNQMDLLFNNSTEFGITASEVMFYFLSIAFIAFVLLCGVLIGVRFWSKTAFSYIVAVLIGLVLVAYLQVLIMNNTAEFDVQGILPYVDVPYFVFTTLLAFTVILAPVFLLKHEHKNKKSLMVKLAILVTAVIFGMQGIGVISASASSIKPIKDNELYYFSIDKQLTLSKNDNVIVFLLDRFDTEFADEIEEKYGEVSDTFSGFTYYRNNTSLYPGTFPSVANLLTGVKYDRSNGTRILNYLKDAWSDSVLLKGLKEKGYKINTLLDSTSTFYDFQDLIPHIDNIEKMKHENRTVRKADFHDAIMRLSLTRQSPAMFKYLFANHRYLDIANYCIDVKDTPDYFPRTISGGSDLVFYNSLINSGLRVDNESEDNVFSFIHLQGCHNPYIYDEHLDHVKNHSPFHYDKPHIAHDKTIAQARGTFKILQEYFDQLRDLGLYDDATIIVTGDHGEWVNTNTKLTEAPTTALFIKESKAKTGKDIPDKLIVDNDSQLSHANFTSTILDLIEYDWDEDDLANREKIAPSYYDAIEGNTSGAEWKDFSDIKGEGVQTRYFHCVRWRNLSYCFYYWNCKIEGDANDVRNWTMM